MKHNARFVYELATGYPQLVLSRCINSIFSGGSDPESMYAVAPKCLGVLGLHYLLISLKRQR